MKTKILLILALCLALLVSLRVSTFSSYTSVSTFGATISPQANHSH